jgi:hypothetical protein
MFCSLLQGSEMFIASGSFETSRTPADVYRLRTSFFAVDNIALLTECGALFIRDYKHSTPPGETVKPAFDVEISLS